MDLLKSIAGKVTELAGDDAVKKTIISQIKGNADNVAAAIQALFGGKFTIPQDVVEKIKGMDDKTLSGFIDKAPSIKSLDELKDLFTKN